MRLIWFFWLVQSICMHHHHHSYIVHIGNACWLCAYSENKYVLRNVTENGNEQKAVVVSCPSSRSLLLRTCLSFSGIESQVYSLLLLLPLLVTCDSERQFTQTRTHTHTIARRNNSTESDIYADMVINIMSCFIWMPSLVSIHVTEFLVATTAHCLCLLWCGSYRLSHPARSISQRMHERLNGKCVDFISQFHSIATHMWNRV